MSTIIGLENKNVFEKIIRVLPGLGKTAHIPLPNKIIICEIDSYTDKDVTHYVIEGEEEPDGHYKFFGITTVGDERKLGCFYLLGGFYLFTYYPELNLLCSDVFEIRTSEKTT